MMEREKLCNWSISSVKIRKMQSGACAAIDAPAFALSSSAPATLIWYPMGRRARISLSNGSTCAVTVGP
ncbi:hypothetical protein D3C72_2493720 [compost metagenome]